MSASRSAAPPRPSRSWAFAALVVGVALWPLAQRALVAREGMDPWRLGGFAMYATYQDTVVGLFEARSQGMRAIDEASLPASVRDELRRFRLRRGALGRLVRPDAVVRAVHTARPELEHLVVVAQRLWLDPETARIASEKEILPYQGGAPFEPGARVVAPLGE